MKLELGQSSPSLVVRLATDFHASVIACKLDMSCPFSPLHMSSSRLWECRYFDEAFWTDTHVLEMQSQAQASESLRNACPLELGLFNTVPSDFQFLAPTAAASGSLAPPRHVAGKESSSDELSFGLVKCTGPGTVSQLCKADSQIRWFRQKGHCLPTWPGTERQERAREQDVQHVLPLGRGQENLRTAPAEPRIRCDPRPGPTLTPLFDGRWRWFFLVRLLSQRLLDGDLLPKWHQAPPLVEAKPRIACDPQMPGSSSHQATPLANVVSSSCNASVHKHSRLFNSLQGVC